MKHDQPAEGFKIEDPKMKKVYEEIRKYALHRQNCLLYGPTGCGKDFLARYYYQEFSKSHTTPGRYVAFNSVGATAEMARSELFGHKKGAFTGASFEKKGLFQDAKDGVLFLDEITHLPSEVQALLLRAIDPGEASQLGANTVYPTKNVVVIAATDSPPEELMPQLLFRLGHIVHVPGLDERPADVPGAIAFMVKNFLSKNNNLSKYLIGMEDEIVRTLVPLVNGRTWPGNFRLLKNVLDSVIIHADTPDKNEFLPKLRKCFLERAEKENTVKRSIHIDPEIKAAMECLSSPWKLEEKERWAEALTSFGTKPFMRRDIENRFSFKSRTANDRIKKLLEANIINCFEERKDLYQVVMKKSKILKELRLKETEPVSLFELPEAGTTENDRKEETNDLMAMFDKTDHIFLAGEPGSGKASLALSAGQKLQLSRNVFYHEIQDNGLDTFIRQMVKYLVGKGYAHIQNLPMFRPFMLHIDAAALAGYINQYFGKKNSPVFILDNLHKLKSREDLDTLQIILKYWKPLKFIFTGDKLSNELIFGEGIGIVEYAIITTGK